MPAGTYAFFVIPTKGAWTVILNKKADQAGTGRDYKQADDLLRVQVKPKAAPFRERLAYRDHRLHRRQGVAGSRVGEAAPVDPDRRRRPAPRRWRTSTAAVDGTWRTYANAARYMLESKKDYDAGLKYVDQSLALKEDWFNLWIKAQLLAAKGNNKDARATGRARLRARARRATGFFLEARGQEGPRRVEEEEA